MSDNEKDEVIHLSKLLSLVRHDPKAYEEEYEQQRVHFMNLLEVVKLHPEKENLDFCSLVGFIGSATPKYPSIAPEVGQLFLNLLREHLFSFHPAIRKAVVRAVISLRNANAIDSKSALPLFFQALGARDRDVRKLVYSHIIGDIRKLNRKGNNPAANKPLQNFMYSILNGDDTVAAKHALMLMIDLYRKDIWNDERTVNVISLSCISKERSLVIVGLRFFLGVDEVDEDEDEDGEVKGLSFNEYMKRRIRVLQAFKRQKKTGARRTRMKKTLEDLKREHKSYADDEEEESTRQRPTGDQALKMLHDPQDFAEKLFARLKSSREKFETRLMMMDLVSRCIALHDLLLLNFYPFLQKYINPSQLHIPRVLAIFAQATHELIPPDVLQPVVRVLADRFVVDNATPEVITIGLNAIREICVRQPLAMDKVLLQDLVKYRRAKDKGIVAGSRGLLNLYRKLAPAMLERKERGRSADLSAALNEYGSTRALDHVPGADLLQAAMEQNGDDENKWLDIDAELEDSASSSEEEDITEWDSDENEPEEEDLEGGEEEDEQDENAEEENDMGEDEKAEEEEDEDDEDDEDDEVTPTPKEKTNPEAKPRLETMKIFDDEDFKRIRALEKRKNDKKRKYREIIDSYKGTFVDALDLEGPVKKRRLEDEERQEEKKERKVKKDRRKTGGGKTHVENARNKPYMMLKHSRKIKQKRRMTAKQMAKRKRISEKRLHKAQVKRYV